MTEYSPEAVALARVQHPDWEAAPPGLIEPWLRDAQRAINAGWTPPPDPHKDIARELHDATSVPCAGDCQTERELLAAVRRIPDDLARQVAEALRADQ